MTQSIPLPVGSYVTADPTASCKRLVNVFSEPAPQDSTLQELKGGNPYQESAPSYLRRWAGITPFANDGTGNPTRGLWVMQGILYAVIGPTLYSVSTTGALTQVGTGIPGSSFVRMTDNTACLVILVPNSKICYTYCPNTASTLVTYTGVFAVDTVGDFATSPTTLTPGMQITVSGSFTPTALSGTTIATAFGGFTCSATTLFVGMEVEVSGTFSGTGSIAGYINPTTYVIVATDGSTQFILETLTGSPLTTVAGTTSGATFSSSGSISGYSSPTIYQIAATDGTSAFTLETLSGEPLVTVTGPISGATFTSGQALQPAFQQLSAENFLQFGAIDVHFLDSYIVFLAQNGREFYNDDGQIVSGPNQITFNTNAIFPREFGTDLFVGMGADHRELSFIGTWSSEGYLNVGNPVGTPFSTAPQSFVELGCHPDAGYSIALQDQALFWVANDKTVRRKNGQTPQRVSNSGIEAILEHANLTGSYALTPNIAGHPLWVYVMPAAYRTIAYDCLTTEWFEIESYKLGYWRSLSYTNAYGKQFVGDTLGQGIGYLDTKVYTEFGDTLVCSFTTQPIYKDHNRIVHRRVECVTTSGADGTQGAFIWLDVSDDAGNIFRGFPMRNLGRTGDFWVRVTWFNLGQSRNRVYRFRISDPTEVFTVQLTTDVELNKW